MIIVYAVCILLQLRRFYGVKSRSCWQEADPRTESAEGTQKSTGQIPAIFFVPSLGGSISNSAKSVFGGRDRVRTCDPLLAKQVLSQLSYTPTV